MLRLLFLASPYLLIGGFFFNLWLSFFLQERAFLSPEQKRPSWIVLIVATILWPIVVPISYIELVKKNKKVVACGNSKGDKSNSNRAIGGKINYSPTNPRFNLSDKQRYYTEGSQEKEGLTVYKEGSYQGDAAYMVKTTTTEPSAPPEPSDDGNCPPDALPCPKPRSLSSVRP